MFIGFGSEPNREAVGSLEEHFSFKRCFASRIHTHSLKSAVKLLFSTGAGQTGTVNNVSAASLAVVSPAQLSKLLLLTSTLATEGEK